MEKIYSKVEPDKLLHFVVRLSDIENQEGFRKDLIEPYNFLQCSSLKMDEGKTFKAHRHNWRNRSLDIIAQESWVVLTGSVKCFFYDINNELIAEPILYPGDSSYTLEAGHTYLILENNTKVLEFKSTPYEGQSVDKTFL